MQFQNRYHRHSDLGVVLIAPMRRTEALTLLTASTPFAYPQVVSRAFRVVSRRQIPRFRRSTSISAPSSIPGSSTGRAAEMRPFFRGSHAHA